MRARRAAAALLIACAAMLPSCATTGSFSTIEPRSQDPVPLQVAKGIVYVPVFAVGFCVVCACAMANGAEQSHVDAGIGPLPGSRQGIWP